MHFIAKRSYTRPVDLFGFDEQIQPVKRFVGLFFNNR